MSSKNPIASLLAKQQQPILWGRLPALLFISDRSIIIIIIIV